MGGILYISPVGTSILQRFVQSSQYRHIVEKYSDKRIREWFRLSIDDPLNTYPDGYICQVVKGHEVYEALREFVRDRPREASAELNGILSTRDLFMHSPSDIEVMLYSTNTCNAMLCMNVVADVLKDLGFKEVQTVKIKAIRSADDFDEGLVEVLDKVVKRVIERKKMGYRVYVSATPGFKAETTFFVLASLLVGVDAITYIHEAFREAVIIPSIPLSIDTKRIKELTEIFKGYCTPKHTLYNLGFTDEKIVELKDRGIVFEKEGSVCIRKWISELIRVLQTT